MQKIFKPASSRLNRSTGKESIQQSASGKLLKLVQAMGGRHV